jgi:glycerol-3-phosphate acyltransferase PlsY
MATALGCLTVYDPRLAVTFAVLFLCLFGLMRRTVLPGLLALAGVALAGKLLDHSSVEVIELSILAGLVLFAHRKNVFEEISELVPHRDEETKTDHSRS